jgi:hypothetical protein
LGKSVYLALIVSILLIPTSCALAQMRTWHDTGGCKGHKLGQCWRLPGQVNACGEPATECCIPASAQLPPSACARRIAAAAAAAARAARNAQLRSAPSLEPLRRCTGDTPQYCPPSAVCPSGYERTSVGCLETKSLVARGLSWVKCRHTVAGSGGGRCLREPGGTYMYYHPPGGGGVRG